MSPTLKFIFQWMRQYPDERFWISSDKRLCCSNGKNIELPLYIAKIMEKDGITPKLDSEANRD